MDGDGLGERVRAWAPRVPLVHEVLHARFDRHAYPAHVHAEWTLLLVDQGGVDYSIGRRARIADGAVVTLLPPGVPHDGRARDAAAGFRKRVAYLDAGWLGERAVGVAADHPAIGEPAVLRVVRRLHAALAVPGAELAAEQLVHELGATLRRRLAGEPVPDAAPAHAARLRELLDADLRTPPTLEAAAAELGTHPGALGRAFARAYGIPPHRYLTGRRVDAARRLLLDGTPPALAAAELGFVDQAHLTRRFRQTLGVTPAAFARGTTRPGLPTRPPARDLGR
ncbi:helix-turn-helix transcriptional regulator [Homoserinibacter sp. YIM 151385]|uniref:helix-turn-helix transcriptional regulator n=1 Tax=Homoserinibacter sp. YIM 151385 TaxID=2985506 RepID=UPI0022F12054|nr:AraC family transcriptional regulator [Homoserinibacter sp. YIM 151385]WBU37415.1 AraC family transcriptional regulator [Homoserinibacter sp. YIM 151385]